MVNQQKSNAKDMYFGVINPKKKIITTPHNANRFDAATNNKSQKNTTRFQKAHLPVILANITTTKMATVIPSS
jgi:hypothetical protein